MMMLQHRIGEEYKQNTKASALEFCYQSRPRLGYSPVRSRKKVIFHKNGIGVKGCMNPDSNTTY